MQLRHLLPTLLVAPTMVAAQATSSPRITEQASGVTALLQATHATSAQVVWASGHRGVVIRTINGGETWEQLVTPGGDSLEFRDVHALNADTAWILAAGSGNKSRIYRTNDGGKTWALQFLNENPDGFYDCMTMFDRSRGIAYGDAANNKTHILRTEDGGATWSLVDSNKVPAPLPGEGAFAASGLCVVHADAKTAFVALGAPGARVFRTIDGGESWTAINTPFVRGRVAGLTGMSFVNARRGIAVGANIDRLRDDKSEQVVGITDDGGLTWSLRSRPPLGGALAGVTWVPSAGRNVAVAVGYGGAFYTTDAAQTWQTITSDGYMGVTAFGKTVWMTGANGKILRLDF